VGADVPQVLEQMRTRLGTRPALTQLPIGAETEFAGAVDLVTMQKVTFSGDEDDAPDVRDLDGALEGEARSAREKLVEIVGDADDRGAELSLAGEPVPAEELRAGLRRGAIARRLVPVLVGSALRNKGIQPLLDAVVDYLPSPLDVPPVH